jgi:hypothetical protein
MSTSYTLKGAASALGITEEALLTRILDGSISAFKTDTGVYRVPHDAILHTSRPPGVDPNSPHQVRTVSMDSRAYVPLYAAQRRSCGFAVGTPRGCFQAGKHVVYRKDPDLGYGEALSILVKDAIMASLTFAGGYAHPGEAGKVWQLSDLRKLAVENPDLQVCPPNLGFWVPWKALLGATE